MVQNRYLYAMLSLLAAGQLMMRSDVIGASILTHRLQQCVYKRLVLTMSNVLCWLNLGRKMPENVIREELEALDIRVQGFMQHRSGRLDQDTSKDRPLTPHFIVSVHGVLKCQGCVL